MKTGETVKYIGKGFIGYDRDNQVMVVIEVEHHDLVVDYNGILMLVGKHEVEALS